MQLTQLFSSEPPADTLYRFSVQCIIKLCLYLLITILEAASLFLWNEVVEVILFGINTFKKKRFVVFVTHFRTGCSLLGQEPAHTYTELQNSCYISSTFTVKNVSFVLPVSDTLPN